MLAISAVVLVGYISYGGLSKLMVSLESTTKPDYRKDHFNELIYSLSQAENSIRVYTITRESQYLAPFYSAINDVDYQMEILYKYAENDPVLAFHLDTIHNLIEKKIDLQKKLIELKEDRTQIDVYQHVLEKIKSIEKRNETLDSLENELAKDEEPELIEQEEVTEEKEEKRGFFRRLFSSNKKNDKEEKETPAIAVDSLSEDTEPLTQAEDTIKKEKISTEIKSSLAEIRIKEQKISKDLTQAELSLTKKDQQISDLIELEVGEVEKYFNQEKIKTTEQASALFEETTRLITIVGTVSAMLFLILVFVILNDIQVNQRFRKRLEQAKKRAEDLAAAKEDFLSNMSHEIRTPMNAILGFTEQLNGASLRPDQQNYLKIIKNASQHLLSIINDILDYNKLEAGKINIEKAPFSATENAHIVFDTLLLNAKNKGLDFTLNIDDLLLKNYLEGDAIRFRQILFNLAGNAIKFTEKGFVEINLRYYSSADTPHLEIVIKDSGIGMSEDELEIIFNKFDQADQSISKKYGGTGLGLAIVKKLADLQNGHVRVSSKVQQGSAFKVTLPYPLGKPISKGKILSAKVTEPDGLQGKRVLIVDDEEYNLLLFKTILEKNKAITRSAASGKEALKILRQEKFDLALLDLQMKDMDGFQTIARIREEIKTDFPVIAITASAAQAIRRKCQKAGFSDVILKPVKEKEFTQLLKQYFHEVVMPENGRKHDETGFPDSLKHVFDLVQNDETLAMNMVNIYRKNIAAARKTLLQGLETEDDKTIREAAHKIIPSTRHMGFEELAAKLKYAENHINNKTDLRSNKKHIDEICSDINNILTWLADFLKKHEDQSSIVS